VFSVQTTVESLGNSLTGNSAVGYGFSVATVDRDHNLADGAFDFIIAGPR
jgi:hypothetical protein